MCLVREYLCVSRCGGRRRSRRVGKRDGANYAYDDDWSESKLSKRKPKDGCARASKAYERVYAK